MVSKYIISRLIVAHRIKLTFKCKRDETMRWKDAANVQFSASTVHLEHITTALSCLTPFGVKEDVLVRIDRDGLSFSRESNHVVRMQLFLSKELFMSYRYAPVDDEPLQLCVKINHILDSVSVAHRNLDDIVECTLSYNGYGSPFVLIFEDSMISERVEYSTYLIKESDNTGLELDRDNIVLECLIKGDVLYAALKDLKEISCKEVYLYANTTSRGSSEFALISKSEIGFSKIKLPNTRSILEKLQIYDGDSTTLLQDSPVIGFFDFSSFDKLRMSVKIASKVLFRMDGHGLLSVNILSQTDDVVVSDTASHNFRNTKRPDFTQNLQLPRDYPGIVIELCMLERESIDEAAQQEISLLMQTNEQGEHTTSSPIKKRPHRDRDPGPVSSSKKLRVSQLTAAVAAPHDSDADSDTPEVPASTTEIPLFF